MNSEHSGGPTIDDWANATLHLTKRTPDNPENSIYELRKRMVINGVEHYQFVWLNQSQLRSIGIEHGL